MDVGAVGLITDSTCGHRQPAKRLPGRCNARVCYSNISDAFLDDAWNAIAAICLRWWICIGDNRSRCGVRIYGWESCERSAIVTGMLCPATISRTIAWAREVAPINMCCSSSQALASLVAETRTRDLTPPRHVDKLCNFLLGQGLAVFARGLMPWGVQIDRAQIIYD